MTMFTSLEICAGAGGLALGLERARFSPVMLIDNDGDSCATLRTNRPEWPVVEMDLLQFVASDHPEVLDVDLMACGVPRPPYSVAGKQRGNEDEGDLLEAAIWLTAEVRPKALVIENVPALLEDEKFAGTRAFVHGELRHLKYDISWKVLDAQDFGVPQRRKHSVLVAMKHEYFDRFHWPGPVQTRMTVGSALRDSMASCGWAGADEWALAANTVAPSIVGGSKKHGGADLGPTGAKNAWAKLNVNGHILGNAVPGADFVIRHGLGRYGRDGLPKLTVSQVALLQGFPADWTICGKKTSSYRQVAQAFPPPLATALGARIADALVN
ncbi:DNA cytosine methyltransferase [Nocardia arthritidis]|uniref:DNA (cytosine-5-)-methyltransferase n=1 Tax=Nocardia arthritidis TaxID=228602 RepID=A0A6G9YNE5_9NOCA|nr:DNA (cytosine-5-)-methyltransferase [Nocardia arthritidis]QIS14722.1 DNA (cytosine-5-)-methyltransferase [Nocardia arthritidis]